jgi:predicted esterase
MGEVHRARHVKLRREVAIKVLPAVVAADPWRRSRFEREARTASALNHPNIVTIHDIAESEGISYIAMELIEGRTLRDLLAEGQVPIERMLAWAEQIADGLAKAHAAGIVHRDIKPANLMVTSDGLIKILDFGLAKPLDLPQGRLAGESSITETQEGLIVGTPHYMSPEQCSGERVDHRSDQFALGVVLYEVLGGKLPFDGPSVQAIMSAIMVGPIPTLKRLRPDVPAKLERLVGRCLEKDPAKRYASTAELATELHRLSELRRSGPRRPLQLVKQPAVAATLIGTVLGLAAAGWIWSQGAERRWARSAALAEITRLTESGEVYAAYRTALRARRYRPDDPALERLFERITLPIAVNSEPAGAEVSVKGYMTPDAAWERIGTTPMTLRIPYALMRWRISKPGYQAFEGAPLSSNAVRAFARGIRLDSAGTTPAGTVRVPGSTLTPLPGVRPPGEVPAVQVDPFFIERYEVTNRQYQEFIDAGGYEREELWPTPIERDGRPVPWRLAMGLFVDGTGRPAPSTWESGRYPPGQEDYPVGGVSWYEAAAYCASLGRNLPTIYHWFAAIGQDQLSDILRLSNMDGDAKAPVGRFQGLAGYGAYDMAGNVKEWAWNSTGHGRYILGGAWNEPTYLFQHLIAQDPMRREATGGVRCVKYITAPPPSLTAAVTPQYQYDRPPPLSERGFAVVRGLYAYDRTPLDAAVEGVNDSLPDYRRETVSFRTAYGNERMQVHLFIPRGVSPPYQSVIWFPGDDVFLLRSSESLSSAYLVDFIPRTGRVLVQPVYLGMYERFVPPEYSPSALRDRIIRWSQDLARTIDYLATRPDFDSSRIAYYGLSAGAVYGPAFTAIEPRFAASILLGGGLIPIPFRPEVHPAALAPWSRTPTLMLNGRDDFMLPYELSERPLFTLLGAPADRKRHVRLEGGHIPSNRPEIIREIRDWLDTQLGPVGRVGQAVTAPSH